MKRWGDREDSMADLFFAAARNPLSAVVFFAVLLGAIYFGFFEWVAGVPGQIADFVRSQ
jgi:hypothetical protein